ncbi:Uncharacterized small protein [Raoultella terrigena]|uniref:Uncharacterized small protein n=1 Tax=Raoultella terrigena TaxID=577 RepID=A0A4U9D389_RAOTE|nr:Uncharacterized small protein [Raoultella terrigena]
MVWFISDEVRRKSGGPRMVVTGFANGMVECRWYDGYAVKREAFREMSWFVGEGARNSSPDPNNARSIPGVLSLYGLAFRQGALMAFVSMMVLREHNE